MIDTTKYTQLLIFKRHWPLSVAIGLTAVAVSVPLILGLPPIYRATAKLTVARQQTGATPAGSGLETRLQFIKQDALSREHIIRLISELNLYPELRQVAPLDVAIDRVTKDIQMQPQTYSVSGGQQATLSFTLTFRGERPETVVEAANRMAQFFVEQNDALRTQQTSLAVQALKQQVDDAQRRLDDVTARQKTYLARNQSRMPDQINTLNMSLTRVATELQIKTAQQTQLRTAIQTLNTQIAAEENRPVAPAAGTVATTPEAQLQEEQARLHQLLNVQNATEANPDVQKTRRRIQQLEQQIAARPANAAAAVVTPLEALRENLRANEEDLKTVAAAISDLEAQSRRLTEQIYSIPTRLPEFDSLSNEARAAQEAYDGVRKAYEQAASAERIEQSRAAEEFTITEPARLPAGPYGPNRVNLIAVSLFLAIVGGLGAAVVRDQLDTSFHTLDELRTYTTVPVLASIPMIVTPGQRLRRTLTMAGAAAMLLVALAIVGYGAHEFGQRQVGITRIVSK